MVSFKLRLGNYNILGLFLAYSSTDSHVNLFFIIFANEICICELLVVLSVLHNRTRS